ncbi:hypothetical protein BDB01DRAFT_849226 [Pilobolus umbonatus]|nr:hypothetical protein BDB01DRAFT_849226 [Pilobolus umbonatus]
MTRPQKGIQRACIVCKKCHLTYDENGLCQYCNQARMDRAYYEEKTMQQSIQPEKKNHHGHRKNSQSSHSNQSESSNDGTNNTWDSIHTQSPTTLSFNSTATDSNTNVHIINPYLESIPDKLDAQDRFYLTAADPKDGRIEDRINEIINAKYQAGFLKPYNYVNGYARLQKYMDQYMSSDSRRRILNVMGMFRPTFRDVAQSLTDIDLILVEEAFERLLLDYDRVFSAMAIPACLWRRTGEIYKGNKEFAELINVPVDKLRDGKLCIYEIMAEDSIVNYWEKYGNIAFDPRQKAVLTSCLLYHQPNEKEANVDYRDNKRRIPFSCCFSFTVRRDKFNM